MIPRGQEEARALHTLQVSLSTGLTPSDPDEVCVDVGPMLLAPGGFFGVSAATSTLAGEDLPGQVRAKGQCSFLCVVLGSSPGPYPC